MPKIPLSYSYRCWRRDSLPSSPPSGWARAARVVCVGGTLPKGAWLKGRWRLNTAPQHRGPGSVLGRWAGTESASRKACLSNLHNGIAWAGVSPGWGLEKPQSNLEFKAFSFKETDWSFPIGSMSGATSFSKCPLMWSLLSLITLQINISPLPAFCWGLLVLLCWKSVLWGWTSNVWLFTNPFLSFQKLRNLFVNRTAHAFKKSKKYLWNCWPK